MKNTIAAALAIFLAAFLSSFQLANAQSPEKLSYQAIVRDANNNLLTQQQVGIQISLLQGSASGIPVYVETHMPTTNENGLITLEIGTGSVESGNFSLIDWANGPYFLKTETDPAGGSNYTITGTSQILSVPYAFYAKIADEVIHPPNETDPVYKSSVAALITVEDTTKWNSKLNEYEETDPTFKQSVAAKITSTDTTRWNGMLEEEADGDASNELQTLSISNDTLFLSQGGKVKLPAETDPDFSVSIASGITAADTANWNNKTTFSGNYYDLLNLPVTENIDSTYLVQLLKEDEDYIDFGTFGNFTNSSDWAIIERVKMPAGTGTQGGWHFFRGKAWADKEGDIAIQISTSQIYVWCYKSGWQSIAYDGTFEEGQWYDICFQYNSTNEALELYINGNLEGQKSGVLPQDDSENTNKLFWGGQDVDPIKNQGLLYSETSIIIAHQAWLQRVLSQSEIENYNGSWEQEPALYFASYVDQSSVLDYSGNGHDGTNGNTPEFLAVITDNGSAFNEPVSVNDNMHVTGDLTIDGTINGSIVVDTIHVSKIVGLLGQGYTLNFPTILDNLVTLEMGGIAISNKVVMVSSLGQEIERTEGYQADHVSYTPGLSMEYPLIFETTSQDDADAILDWYLSYPEETRDGSIIVKNVTGTETSRWNYYQYKLSEYGPGVDGRTRFTFEHNLIPDNVLGIEFDAQNGQEWAFNPETDTRVEIEGVSTGTDFCPQVELDETNHTLTLTYDYNEGGDIYAWVKYIIQGNTDKRAISVVETTDGSASTEIGRYNHYGCFPIKFEQFYGFGLTTKVKSRIVISYDYREEA